MLVYFFRCHGFAIRLARFIWMSESAHDHYFPTNSRSIWHWFYRKYRFLEKELINCHFRHYRLSVYYNETSKSLSSSSLKCVDRRKIPNRKHHNRYIQINVGATDHNFEMIRKRPWFAIRLRAIHPDTREDTYLLFRYTFLTFFCRGILSSLSSWKGNNKLSFSSLSSICPIQWQIIIIIIITFTSLK